MKIDLVTNCLQNNPAIAEMDHGYPFFGTAVRAEDSLQRNVCAVAVLVVTPESDADLQQPDKRFHVVLV